MKSELTTQSRRISAPCRSMISWGPTTFADATSTSSVRARRGRSRGSAPRRRAPGRACRRTRATRNGTSPDADRSPPDRGTPATRGHPEPRARSCGSIPTRTTRRRCRRPCRSPPGRSPGPRKRSRIAGEPGIRAFPPEGLDDPPVDLLVPQRFAGLPVDEHGDGNAPGALARDHPFRPLLHHGIDPGVAAFRHPSHLVDGLQRGLPQVRSRNMPMNHCGVLRKMRGAFDRP